MSKKTKVLSGLALVAGTVAISANAQAEEVTAQVTPEAPVTTAQEATETTVTTEALAQASEVATSTQASVVATASSEVASQSAVVSSLTSEVAKANVTEQDLSNAQATIESAQAKVTATSEALKTAQETETIAQDKVSSQESIVADAQAKASETASEVADAQSKVDALSGSTDTTALEQGVADLTTKVASDKDAVSSAQSALEAAKLAESNKAEAVSQQQEVVAEAEQAVDSSAKALVEATSTKDSTQAALSEAQSALETAQKGTVVTETIKTGETTSTTGATASLNSGVAYSNRLKTNGILVNQEYLDAVKDLANGTGTTQAVKDAIATGIRKNSLVNLNAADSSSYQSWMDVLQWSFSDTDNTTKVNVIDLTDEQLTDLSLFYAALVNDLRAKLGTPLLTVSTESIATSKAKVEEIFSGVYPNYANMSGTERADNGFWGTVPSTGYGKDPSNELDIRGGGALLSSVTASANDSDTTFMVSTPANRQNYTGGDGRYQTMAELKGKILASLGYQLLGLEGSGNFNEGDGGVDGQRVTDFGSALEVLGLTGNSTSVGVDFDFLNYNIGQIQRQPQFFTVFSSTQGTAIDNPYMTVTGGTTTVTPIYETVTRTVVDPVLVANAQANLTKAQVDFDNAQSAYETARTAYETAQATFTSAQSTLADLINGTVDVASLETALSEAQATLSQDEQALQSAKETLALAKASATDKAIALSKAQASLTSAKEADALAQSTLVSVQATLAQLKAELSQAQSATADAKTAYTNAQATLETAKAQLEAMKTAQANLPSLVEQFTQAQAKLEELEALLATEEENLVDLEAIADEALAIYKALLAQYQTQEVQAQRDAIIKNGGQPVAIKDENGVIVAYVDGRVDEKQAIQTAYNKAVTKQVSAKFLKEKPQATYQAKSASLPNTGDDQTAIFSLMGLAMLGLAGVGVKRRFY